MKNRMKPLPWTLALLACSFAAPELARGQVIYKQADAFELDVDLNELEHLVDSTLDPGAVSARITLGNDPYINTRGEATRAWGYANDGGKYFVEVNADNLFSPDNNGSGRAEAFLHLRLRRDSPTDSPVMHVSGGELWLNDFGGGYKNLLAEVGVATEVLNVYTRDTYVTSSVVRLEGRGGTLATETFDATFNRGLFGHNFEVYEEDYHESAYTYPTGGTNVFEALLEIQEQAVAIDISGICIGCEFYLSINAWALAENPTGEGAARAYFRDPLHLGGLPELGEGASFLELSGVTLLDWEPVPAPEPEPLALVLVAASLWLLTKRSIMGQTARRWFGRASSSPGK